MNGIIVINKEQDWTSNDVVSKLKGVLRERRIGHSGTLDPMATGVLPVFIGRATRAVEFCESAEKEYIASFRAGVVTDTQDTTGTVLCSRPAEFTDEQLRLVLKDFIGEQEQIPPMYSALKYKGQKLYDLARKGIEVERKPRKITIKELEIIEKLENGDYSLKVICSKGTYIRTLCSDIGERLGCGGAMSALRRTRAGSFSIGQAVGISDVQRAVTEGRISDLLMPVDGVFSEYGRVVTDREQEKKCRCGNDFAVSGVSDGKYRVYSSSGEFLMLGQCAGNIMKTVKSFFEV